MGYILKSDKNVFLNCLFNSLVVKQSVKYQ
jgi:hypothetical protein